MTRGDQPSAGLVGAESQVPELSCAQLIGRLEELVLSLPASETGPRGALAFDGDGTLWLGDVGEDVFHALLAQAALKAELVPALEAFAAEHCIEETHAALAGAARAQALAQTLFRAYVAERVPERNICELMAWCFAGWTNSERRAFIGEVLEQRGLGERRIAESNRVLEWARGEGLRCVLISASPDAVVEVAGAIYGFERSDIQGIRTAMHGDIVGSTIEGPTTYAEGKAEVGSALLGATPWLAAFGDSTFDAAMMRKAKLGVGVRSKPSLLIELGRISGGVRLAQD